MPQDDYISRLEERIRQLEVRVAQLELSTHTYGPVYMPNVVPCTWPGISPYCTSFDGMGSNP